MKFIEHVYKQLERDEGKELNAYKDHLGNWTIGIGHLLSGDVNTYTEITEDECRELFERDVENVFNDLDRNLPWWRDLSDARKGVLVNMCFNLGINRLLGFKKTLALIRQGKYEEASKEMLDSLWAKQVGNRAKRLSQQLKDGVWV